MMSSESRASNTPTLAMLGVAIRNWVSHTRKSDAHDGADNERERRIIDLAGPTKPFLTVMLHRGQGVPDHVVNDLVARGHAMLPASKRLISSWTTSLEVARDFAQDAAGDGMSALVISMPAELLDVIVDVTTLDVDASEREVIVKSADIALMIDHIPYMWRYDDDKGASIPCCIPRGTGYL